MDPVTIGVIATTAVSFLSPYLAKAGEAAARKVGEDVYEALKARFGRGAERNLKALRRAYDETTLSS